MLPTIVPRLPMIAQPQRKSSLNGEAVSQWGNKASRVNIRFVGPLELGVTIRLAGSEVWHKKKTGEIRYQGRCGACSGDSPSGSLSSRWKSESNQRGDNYVEGSGREGARQE